MAAPLCLSALHTPCACAGSEDHCPSSSKTLRNHALHLPALPGPAGRVLRCAKPTEATPRDVALLLERLGVKDLVGGAGVQWPVATGPRGRCCCGREVCMGEGAAAMGMGAARRSAGRSWAQA